MKRLLFALLLLALLPLSAQAVAPTFSFSPASPSFKEGDTTKQTIKVVLNKVPLSDTTITLTPPTGGGVVLGKTSLKFTLANYNKDDDAHNFGVTLTDKAKAGESLAIKLTGNVNGTAVDETLTVSVAAKNSGAGPVDNTIKAKDLPGADINLQDLLPKIVRGFLILIAISAFFGLLYSGIMYITAGGDAAKAQTARKNIVWALTGVIIAVMSYSIVNLVANWSNLGFGTGLGGGGATANNHDTGELKILGENQQELTLVTLATPTSNTTTNAFFHLSSKPTTTTTVTIGVEGQLPLALSSDRFVFTPDNWQTDQLLIIIYAGNGQLGDDAIVTFNLNDQTVYSLPFTFPDTGTTGDDENSNDNGLIDTNDDNIDDATAPTLVVMTDNSTDAVTTYRLDQAAAVQTISLRVLIESDPIEGAELTITTSATGQFPLTVTPGSLTFNARNWARSQTFTVKYAGNGQAGQRSVVNFSLDGRVIHSVNFTLP